MIKNKKQENLTIQEVVNLKNDIEKVSSDDKISDIEKEFSINALDGMLQMLNDELEEYKALTKGNLHLLQAKSLEELPQLLIKARIAKDMSQTDLANKLGIAPQQIQRYEANDYQTLSFYRLVEIATILDLQICFKDIIIVGNGPKFELPENVTEADALHAEELIQERCSLVI